MIELMKLPYSQSALEPHISKECIKYHYGKHHKKYVETLNSLIQGTELEKADLETIVKQSSGKTYNQAAQVWNHNLFWNCLSPWGGGKPKEKMNDLIRKDFGSFDKFKEYFKEMAVENFGSGWTWAVVKDNHLTVINSANADNPLKESGVKILFTLDVWEHAYYMDYQNKRDKFIDNFWKLINWEYIDSRI